MSTNKAEELEAADEVCASCGIAAVDDVKLKSCDGGCDLVKYCGDECQENHREQHEAACEKRSAEMHDKKLFTQPDSSHHGECSICCLPLSIDKRKSKLMVCCCKVICKGCNYANIKREWEQGLEHRCAFCREPLPKFGHEKPESQLRKRIKKNDPVAMTQMGKICNKEGDHETALAYFAKAAELGEMDAHCGLGILYYKGDGVEKDEKRAVYHFEQAAIGGHPLARAYLATHERNNGRPDRAAKHFIIGANLGCDLSLKYVKDLFIGGDVRKEDYAAALRGYQAAVDATKSAEREEGEKIYA